jgi:hypothetical protein
MQLEVIAAEHSQGCSMGGVMSPTAPRPQRRTARRSVPTPEGFRANSKAVPQPESERFKRWAQRRHRAISVNKATAVA